AAPAASSSTRLVLGSIRTCGILASASITYPRWQYRARGAIRQPIRTYECVCHHFVGVRPTNVNGLSKRYEARQEACLIGCSGPSSRQLGISPTIRPRAIFDRVQPDLRGLRVPAGDAPLRDGWSRGAAAAGTRPGRKPESWLPR